ncbi:MAG: hypothetical protein PHP81_03515 [Patescibacteria group bacterium]|nr:hypothetical protein [Patescibacteria group bacterium]
MDIDILLNKEFSCQGERLTLAEIRQKKIIAITFQYFLAPRKIRQKSLRGFLKKRQIVYYRKELKIEDKKGIELQLSSDVGYISLRFWDKAQWEKLNDYDKLSLEKRYMLTDEAPYIIAFKPDNLLAIEWQF